MRRLRDVLLVSIFFIAMSCSTENTPVYQLTTSSNPAEAGSVSPEDNEYDEGEEVSITATPNEGWIFDGWQGDLSGSENPATFTIDSDKNVTALFIKKTYPLTVTVEGEGTVQETVIQEKSIDYEHGTTVELTAQPADGSEFTGWTGAVESTENPLQITVEEPAEITAIFETTNMFFLAENGVTIKCPTAKVGEKGTVNGVEYEAVDRELLDQRINEEVDLTKVCTSLITSMRHLFANNEFFNQPIGNWDVSNVTNMHSMFVNTATFNQPLENWDVSNVTTMETMFYDAKSFNQPIGNWDVSNVTLTAAMFENAESFNQPLNNWNVSNVTFMASMFYNAKSFDQPLNNWDVSNVISMAFMFDGAHSFNQPIGNWNVGKVENMRNMFALAESFNQPIGSWDISNVEDMRGMFETAVSFNQNINNWNVSNVTNMNFMFKGASSFNKKLDDWNVSNVTTMLFMFHRAKSFNQPIETWDVSNVTKMQAMFSKAFDFNQNLSTWCVSNISSEPIDFSDGSALEEDHKPIWGTCPE